MANERIVATIIYYYDSENIEGDELSFRQAVGMKGAIACLVGACVAIAMLGRSSQVPSIPVVPLPGEFVPQLLVISQEPTNSARGNL